MNRRQGIKLIAASPFLLAGKVAEANPIFFLGNLVVRLLTRKLVRSAFNEGVKSLYPEIRSVGLKQNKRLYSKSYQKRHNSRADAKRFINKLEKLESLTDLASAAKEAWGTHMENTTTVTVTNTTPQAQRSKELEILAIHPSSKEVITAYIPPIDVPSNSSIIYEVEYQGLPYGKNIISLKPAEEGTASRILRDIMVMKDSDLKVAQAEYRRRLASFEGVQKGSASKILEELMNE